MRIAKSVAGGKIRRAVLLMALLAVVPGLAGCGSTKVYTAEKTLVYRDNLYNLGQVQQVGSRIDLAPAGGQAEGERRPVGREDRSHGKPLVERRNAAGCD